MISKLDRAIFIGTHKEQKSGGGAQDNQATDASFLFNYTENELNRVKSMFNVENVYLVIFLERGKAPITSSHWKRIFEIIKDRDNSNKYLVSSTQFIELVDSMN